MKKWFVVAICLALSACARNHMVSYVPNPNVIEPTKVIEQIIRTQPPAYARPVPYAVSVKNDYIELQVTEPGGWFGGPGNVTNTIYYKNIGKVILNKYDIWCVEILDRAGNWMYYVWSFDESEAKLFIDALYTMMGRQ